MIKFKKMWKVGKKRIEIEVEIGDTKKIKDWNTLKEIEIIPVSFMGEVFIGKDTESCCAGQIVDELPDDGELGEVKRIWKQYHLNDMVPGTKRQFWALGGKFLKYKKEVERLKEHNLYEDRGYKYGWGWLGKPVPKQIIDRLLKIFSPA